MFEIVNNFLVLLFSMDGSCDLVSQSHHFVEELIIQKLHTLSTLNETLNSYLSKRIRFLLFNNSLDVRCFNHL